MTGKVPKNFHRIYKMSYFLKIIKLIHFRAAGDRDPELSEFLQKPLIKILIGRAIFTQTSHKIS